jgi:uncharacterized iron-regulated membrane protein
MIELLRLRALHKYCGLAIAIFLLLVAITGSLLAFYPELEKITSPQFYVEPVAHHTPLGFEHFIRIAESRNDLQVTQVTLDTELDQHRVVLGVVAHNPDEIHVNQLILNPYTGEILGSRYLGDLSEGLHNLMPFIYEFHYTLMLGNWGIWILGITAIIWIFQSLLGLFISFPKRGKHSQNSSFFKKWKSAWLIKFRSSTARIHFDIHRAMGLWLLIVCLVFAWSSVYMNLWDNVYTKITEKLMPFHPPWAALEPRPDTPQIPPTPLASVLEHANQLMLQTAAQHNFNIIKPVQIRYYPNYGAFRFRVLSDRDLSSRFPRTDIYLDATTHQLLLVALPNGQYTGNTVSTWLYALHTGRVWGTPYRIFICLLGIALTLITITSLLIWWRKKSRRYKRKIESNY